MRLGHLTIIGAVLTAICVTLCAQAAEPSTRPAPPDRRGNPDGAVRRQGPPPGQLFEQFRAAAKDLNLTEQQQARVESALRTAGEEFKAIRDEIEGMEPRDRRERVEKILGKLRQEMNAALTEEQRQTLRTKMSEQRPGGQRPAGEGTGPTTRPGPLVERLQQGLARLELSDEQKKRIEGILADVKSQMDEVREGLMAGDEAARAKVGELMMDIRRQVGEVLTAEQREELRKMSADGPPTPGRRGEPGQRGRRPGGDEMMDKDMMSGDEMRDGAPPRRRPGFARDDRRSRPPTPAPLAGSGAKVGTAAPGFELTKIDGKPFRLESFNGRVVVLVFGSYSSPSFRQRAPEIEALAKQFGSRAQFLIVYTKEAHPAGEWDVERNKDVGIAVDAHQDAEARVAQARKAQDALKLSIPVAPDTMDDAVSAAFGTFPNGAVVIGRDGTIVARQQWVDPGGLENRIEQAMKTPTSKPAP